MNAGDQVAAPSPTDGDLKTGAQNMRVMLTFILVGFAATFMVCVGLVIHLRQKRNAALRGDSKAATKIVLPAFEPLLMLLGVVNGTYVLFLVITLSIGYYDEFVPPLVLESFYSGNVFDFVVVLVLLMQKSISIQALGRTVGISLLLCTYTIAYAWYVTTHGDPKHQQLYVICLFLLRSIAYLPFLYAFIRPPSRATSRVIREFCAFAIIHYGLTTLLTVLLLHETTIMASRYVMYTTLTYVTLTPLAVWRVLRADTDYWRGLGERALALRDLVQHDHSIQEHASARGLHVLIEVHRKDIIDFAYLDLEHQIGVGSTANVFQGTLKAKMPVAVKVYTPTSVNDDVLTAFSREAAMCSALRHPNVVSFVGLCISPPAVCLVFELCQGNLEDIMGAHARRKYHPARQQMLINVGYMLDAARAVAYLHSFSPPCLHRDIQPANFLVDMECNVKLADFGESRGIAVLANLGYEGRTSSKQQDTTGGSKAKGGPESSMEVLWNCTATTSKASAYMAPEVLQAERATICYSEASDIYALGVTMRDILYPFASHLQDTRSGSLRVCDPLLNHAADQLQLDRRLPPALRDLINSSLHSDAQRRPTAQSMVVALEELQYELSVDVVSRMMTEFRQVDQSAHEIEVSGTSGPDHRFTGMLAADWMVDCNYASSLVEGVRMGNAFMDAGLLHHTTHSRRFENSNEIYYFDADTSKGHQAMRTSHNGVSILEVEGGGGSRNFARVHFQDVGIPILSSGTVEAASQSSRSYTDIANGDCACRRLAQRLHVEPTEAKQKRSKTKGFFAGAKDVSIIMTGVVVEEDAEPEHSFDRMVDSIDKTQFAASA